MVNQAPSGGDDDLPRLKFLDGLRGWAAIFVLLYHVFCDAIPFDDRAAALLQLFLPFSGIMAIFIFFVVSGFSLSVDYLDRGDLKSWVRIVAGRYFRLTIPIFLACLVVHLAMIAGAISPGEIRHPKFQQGLAFAPTWQHLFYFSWYGVFFDYRDTYVGPLWTMRYELFGSFIALAGVIALRRAPARIFWFSAIAVILSLVLDDYWRMLALFPAGCVLADLHLRGWLNTIPRPVGWLLILAGFLSVPLRSWIGWELGVLALVVGCVCLDSARTLLGSKTSRLLGDICYPLYLIHGPVIWLVGEPLLRRANGSIMAGLVIDIAVVILSLLAAVLFLPANNLAIVAARWIGARAASFAEPRQPARITSSDGTVFAPTRTGPPA
ncbi:acyltransferase [Bradyrhizobium sp. S3.9.1]|uniref:acyltransferase family protein n=1 Tax=unclassified Bradyrhizobium TaxID=2631580 RepID=UPI00339A2343